MVQFRLFNFVRDQKFLFDEKDIYYGIYLEHLNVVLEHFCQIIKYILCTLYCVLVVVDQMDVFLVLVSQRHYYRTKASVYTLLVIVSYALTIGLNLIVSNL